MKVYIRDVIERVKTYYPSEYDEREMYPWCDEVSSMIAIEDKCAYAQATLVADSDRCVMLPDGVEFHNIISVMVGDKELKKTNLKLTSPQRLNVGVGGEVVVVYLVPYSPIRSVEYKGEAECVGDTIYLAINPFVVGDNVRLITAEGERLVNVVGVSYVPNMAHPFAVTLGMGQLEGLDGTLDVTLTRQVTDKTMCHAPYDIMYVDYLMAKIALFQRDYQMYNQFMTSFNSRLGAYKRWLINYVPQDGGVLKNYW